MVSLLGILHSIFQVHCPARFVKNAGASVGGGETSSQFCVGTCPSNALVKDEQLVLWCLYVVPGSLAFVVNAAALISMRVATASGTPKTQATTVMLVRLSVLFGLVGVLPVALMRDDLVCTCDSELCLSRGFLCKLNQTSIYLVMACCFCLLQKFTVLLVLLKSPWTHVWRSKVDTAWARCLVWLVPFLLAVISFGVEEHDANERFHLARAGIRCQFRYKSIFDEALLVHVPMGACVVLMVYYVCACTHLCLEAMQQQRGDRSFRSLGLVLQRRPQMLKMLFNSLIAIVLMAVWLSQAEASRLVFQSYFELQDAWLACVRFDFARHAAVGVAWKEELTSSGADGTLCPASPQGNGLLQSHLYRSLFETLMPAMVAMSFSWGLVVAALARRKAARKVADESAAALSTAGSNGAPSNQSGRDKSSRVITFKAAPNPALEMQRRESETPSPVGQNNDTSKSDGSPATEGTSAMVEPTAISAAAATKGPAESAAPTPAASSSVSSMTSQHVPMAAALKAAREIQRQQGGDADVVVDISLNPTPQSTSLGIDEATALVAPSTRADEGKNIRKSSARKMSSIHKGDSTLVLL